jgi:Myotubularin-like phosphatase domain
MPGLTLTRSQHDEQLISAIFATNLPAPLANGQIIYGSKAANLIIDARPAANAMVMTAMGAGTENMENYKMCTKLYMGIDNIHVVRDSLNRLYDGETGIVALVFFNSFFCHSYQWLRTPQYRHWKTSAFTHKLVKASLLYY